ncbi:MAG: DUF2892 domain-containing protein [Candidatus Thermoplasmatota archaeon]|jgi:hypothetical protein|nr:DUF2892 domain-containing protein [Candidatus Thermoplasmatota archaeon]|tara:strand:+ start:294 stop:527 length:234 start_codon:yes stop_codon:yes gene_type:complete
MSENSGFKLFVTNQSNTERIIRAVIALIIIIAGYFVGSPVFEVGLMLAGVLIFNAVSGNCYIYRMFGFSTCPLPDAE